MNRPRIEWPTSCGRLPAGRRLLTFTHPRLLLATRRNFNFAGYVTLARNRFRFRLNAAFSRSVSTGPFNVTFPSCVMPEEMSFRRGPERQSQIVWTEMVSPFDLNRDQKPDAIGQVVYFQYRARLQAFSQRTRKMRTSGGRGRASPCTVLLGVLIPKTSIQPGNAFGLLPRVSTDCPRPFPFLSNKREDPHESWDQGARDDDAGWQFLAAQVFQPNMSISHILSML